MTTTLRRIQVTETPEVAQALTIGMRRWPEAPRSQIIARLAALGAREIQSSGGEDGLPLPMIGLLPGVYEPGYLDDLRSDWPA
ncbi:MAG: hypothetical protein LBM23_00355 [Propionibacteriaceae bacterium]|nr:hypothetical protein [Propionibacteriaceae bacterium]